MIQIKLILLIFSTNTIRFIPAINVDGYNFFKQNFNNKFNLFARKNRHKEIECHSDLEIGVDLNRNYETAFGYDDKGGSNNPCEENYRGKYPFSEKET